MNKIEKIICLALGAVLAWYIWAEMGKAKERAAEAAKQSQVVMAAKAAEGRSGKDSAAPVPDAAQPPQAGAAESAPIQQKQEAASLPDVPEKLVALENAQLKLELSSWGAVVKRATLKEYAKDCGEISETNPAVTLDFSAAPLGELGGVPGLAANAAYEVRDVTSNSVVFVNAFVTRKITLGEDFRVTFDETFRSVPSASASTSSLLSSLSLHSNLSEAHIPNRRSCNAGSLLLPHQKGRTHRYQRWSSIQSHPFR